MLVLIVDTNLFHEFRPLRELPWEELGTTDEIILIVSEPVQTELDEQKKSRRSRLKKRALEWTKTFRRLVLSDETDIELRQAGPRVVLRLDDTRPDRHVDDVLDIAVADDAIVAIGLALRSRFSDARVAMFSDDLRPLRKARQVSLEAIAIPEDWRREPEQTEEDKARERLEGELALLRRQEPQLILASPASSPVDYVLPIYDPLSEDQADELIGELLRRHPVETNFERDKDGTALGKLPMATVAVSQHVFRPPPRNEIARYTKKLYPDWIETCHERLRQAHETFGMSESGLTLRIELSNEGTRPADDLQVVFECRGDVGIMPKPNGDSSLSGMGGAEPFSLPEPPKAPHGEWRTIGELDIYNGGFGQALQYPEMPPLPRTLEDVIRDQKRDPNAFYYRDRPSVPVSRYDLTCAQFRHADAHEGFDVYVRPSGEAEALDGKSAIVEVACHAANLTAPERLKIPLRFRCERRSTYDAVRDFIFGSGETGSPEYDT